MVPATADGGRTLDLHLRACLAAMARCSFAFQPGPALLAPSRRLGPCNRATGLPAHRAGPDAYVTAYYLRDMLAVARVSQLLA